MSRKSSADCFRFPPCRRLEAALYLRIRSGGRLARVFCLFLSRAIDRLSPCRIEGLPLLGGARPATGSTRPHVRFPGTVRNSSETPAKLLYNPWGDLSPGVGTSGRRGPRKGRQARGDGGGASRRESGLTPELTRPGAVLRVPWANLAGVSATRGSLHSLPVHPPPGWPAARWRAPCRGGSGRRTPSTARSSRPAATPSSEGARR